MTGTAAIKEKPDYSYLPKEVAKQAAAADKLFADAKEGKTELSTPGEIPAGEIGSADKPIVLTEEVQKSTSSGKPTETETVPPVKPTEDWQGKYVILQGKYNAEVPRLAREIRQLKEQNTQLQAEIQQVQASQPKLDPNAGFKSDEFTEEDLEMMEPEVRKLYEDHKVLRLKYSDLESKFGQIENGINETRQTTTQTALFSRLDMDERIKGWRQQNIDPDFLTWLPGRDPLSGQSFGDMLNDAEKQGDAERIVGIFLKFQSETGKNYSASKPQTIPNNQTTIPKPATAPPRSRSDGAPTAPPEGKIYSRKEIEQFYNDQARGKYNGRDDEVKRIEADIMKAQRDGRIR